MWFHDRHHQFLVVLFNHSKETELDNQTVSVPVNATTILTRRTAEIKSKALRCYE